MGAAAQFDATGELAQFRTLLEKLFQFEDYNLDFGIYRILNLKREQVRSFLDVGLPKLVEQAFEVYKRSDEASLKQQLSTIEGQIRLTLGPEAIDGRGKLLDQFADVPIGQKYRDMRAMLQESKALPGTEESVYNQLYTFFSRYYSDGDFIAKRRFGRKDAYAVPFNGEELLFYWVNRDQYYAKSTTQFKIFRLAVDDFIVTLELKSSAPGDGNECFFALQTTQAVAFDPSARTLSLYFERRPLTASERSQVGGTKANIQSRLNGDAEKQVLDVIGKSVLAEHLFAMQPDGSGTVFQQNLRRFIKGNTSDFFVHKNLKAFLTEELEFFIKAEAWENTDPANSDRMIRRNLVVRSVAEAIIDLLAQIEDFQKLLFEKKKFVVETNYCITMDRVPRQLWSEILRNDSQVAEWQSMFDLHDGASGPVRVDESLVQATPGLMVDTRHFSEDFKWLLLSGFEDIDRTIDGIAFKSDSFQALNLMLTKYKGSVKCVYTAPPYNTGDDGFLYKEGYRHSSWLTMLRDRIELTKLVMRDDGALFMSIDDTEAFRAQMMLVDCFGIGNFLAGLVWQKRYSPPPDTSDIGYVHELILAFRKGPEFKRNLLPLTDAQKARYKNPDNDPRGPWKAMDYTARYTSIERPNLFYPVKHPQTGEEIWPKKTRVWACSREEHDRHVQEDRLWWGRNGTARVPSLKNFLSEIQQGFMPTSILSYEDVGHTDAAAKELRSLFPAAKFPVKPTKLVSHVVTIAANKESLILDFFAGSGETAHGTINLNRSDQGSRKYILVENKECFWTLLLPRIKKVAFSSQWKDGKPAGSNPVSHLVKYQVLEQYEDSLNNIELPRSHQGQRMLAMFGDQYVLKYMFNLESAGSPAMLDVAAFSSPFEYRFLVPADNGTKRSPIDLVETFNYLLGIHVLKMYAEHDGNRTYRAIAGEREGVRFAIVWRATPTEPPDVGVLQRDRDFIERNVLPALWDGKKPDRIFVNGPCFVAGAEAIEVEFSKLMFSQAK